MVGSEDLGLGFEGFFEEWDGVVGSACILVGEGEVVAGVEGVGVVGAEDSLRLLRRVLEDLNGAAEIARLCGDRRQRLLDGEHLLRPVVQPGGGQGDVPVCVAGLVELTEAERQVSPLPRHLVDQFWLGGAFEPRPNLADPVAAWLWVGPVDPGLVGKVEARERRDAGRGDVEEGIDASPPGPQIRRLGCHFRNVSRMEPPHQAGAGALGQAVPADVESLPPLGGEPFWGAGQVDQIGIGCRRNDQPLQTFRVGGGIPAHLSHAEASFLSRMVNGFSRHPCGIVRDGLHDEDLEIWSVADRPREPSQFGAESWLLGH